MELTREDRRYHLVLQHWYKDTRNGVSLSSCCCCRLSNVLFCSSCLRSRHASCTFTDTGGSERCVGNVCSEDDEICYYPLQTIPLTLPGNPLLTVLRIRPNTDTKNLLYEVNIKEWFPTRCCYFPEQVMFELFIYTTRYDCSVYWSHHNIVVKRKTKNWIQFFKCRLAETVRWGIKELLC